MASGFLSAVLMLMLLLLNTTDALGNQLGVYVKLFPGKEFCVKYDAFRDPEADPVTVSFQHRCIDPRLIHVNTKLYGPSKDLSKRGPLIELTDNIDTFGDISDLYFEATETGTYTLCMRTPVHHPAVRFDMHFVAANDIVPPPLADDDAVVVDKPTSMEDYDNRLRMLDVSIETTVTELRMYTMRRFMLDHTVFSTFCVVVVSVLVNALLALGISWWSEKYLERYFIKQKIE